MTKGQVPIPQDMRDELGLLPNPEVTFGIVDSEAQLRSPTTFTLAATGKSNCRQRQESEPTDFGSTYACSTELRLGSATVAVFIVPTAEFSLLRSFDLCETGCMSNGLGLRVLPFRRGAWLLAVSFALPVGWGMACGGESKPLPEAPAAPTAQPDASAAWHVTPPYAWRTDAASSASASASVKAPPPPPTATATATAKDSD